MRARKAVDEAELCSLLKEAVQDARDMASRRRERYEKCRAEFYGGTTAKATGSLDTTDTFQLSQMAGSAMVAETVAALFSQRPFGTFKTVGGESLDLRTSVTQRMADVCNLPLRFREATVNAWWNGRGWLRFHEADDDGKVRCEAVDPMDVLCWPVTEPDATRLDVWLCQCVTTRREAEHMVKAGAWSQVPHDGSSEVPVSAETAPSVPAKEAGIGRNVFYLDGFARFPGTKDWFFVTCSNDGATLLAHGPCHYGMALVAGVEMTVFRTGDGAYPSVSKGSDQQGCQGVIDSVLANMLVGMAYAARPAVFVNDPKFADGKALRPGMAVYADATERVVPIPGVTDVAGSAQVIDQFVTLSGRTSGSSGMSQGAPERGVDTATEATNIRQGASVASDACIQVMGGGGLSRSLLVLDALARFDPRKRWKETVDDGPGFDKDKYLQEGLKAATVYPAVTSAQDTPQAQVAMLDGFAAIAERNPDKVDFVWPEYMRLRAQKAKLMGVGDVERLVGDPVEWAFETILDEAESQGVDREVLSRGITAAVQGAASATAGLGFVPQGGGPPGTYEMAGSGAESPYGADDLGY